MNQPNTGEALLTYPIVPVFYHSDPATCLQVFDACYQGGVRLFEFTNRGDNALETFIQLNDRKKQYEDYIIGAGTILTGKDCEAFILAGASFIVSPCYVQEVANICDVNNVPYLPGCMTVKEVWDAVRAGCDFVKVFPGEVVGAGFVKAVKAVFPKVKLMVTGGVSPTLESLTTWFDAGVDAVGMGSQLFKKAWLEEAAFGKITETCKECFAAMEHR